MPYRSTPIQEILRHPLVDKAGVRLLVKREDLNHPFISGNKWWKLKYNLMQTIKDGCDTILTFGGAYSNHLYATAAAARELRLKAIGIIRGERTYPLNRTLTFAMEQGMQLQFISRADYKEKTSAAFVDGLRRQLGNFFLIPEGGSNALAVQGCAEFAAEELSKIDFDHLFLPVGTGGTMAGMVAGLNGRRNITGVSILKGGDFLRNEIDKMIKDYCANSLANWTLTTRYHGGGYAKITPPLLSFIEEMKTVFGLPLDPIYTGKTAWAILKEIECGSFARGSTILMLHTGGLQGAMSLNRIP